MQHSSPLNPPFSRPIPIETELVSEIEKLYQNESPSLVKQVVASDDHGDMVLVLHEYTHSNPHIHKDLELWHHIRDYDKANVEMPFTPVLSKKQKQQVKK